MNRVIIIIIGGGGPATGGGPGVDAPLVILPVAVGALANAVPDPQIASSSSSSAGSSAAFSSVLVRMRSILSLPCGPVAALRGRAPLLLRTFASRAGMGLIRACNKR